MPINSIDLETMFAPTVEVLLLLSNPGYSSWFDRSKLYFNNYNDEAESNLFLK